MNQAQRIAEYKEYSPRDSRFTEERYLLFLEDITAVFDGFKALDIEALGIEYNELRVIIGPNGAGKTTLVRCREWQNPTDNRICPFLMVLILPNRRKRRSRYEE